MIGEMVGARRVEKNKKASFLLILAYIIHTLVDVNAPTKYGALHFILSKF